MLFSHFANPIGWAAVAASLCRAGSVVPAPFAPPNVAHSDDLIRRAVDLALRSDGLAIRDNEATRHAAINEAVRSLGPLERRDASVSLAHSWINDVLFNGSFQVTALDDVHLTVICVECYTKGTITASISHDDIFDPKLRLDFSGIEAYMDVALAITDTATYTINLFTSETPIGIGVSGLYSAGVIFAVDLVFSLTAEVDLEAGFDLVLEDGAFIEASLFDGGDIGNFAFDGAASHALPVTVHNGGGIFKADLRLRLQAGVEADTPVLSDLGFGAGAVVGMYLNLIEFVAELVEDDNPGEGCELETIEWWDMNAGAYARLDVVIDYSTFGFVPTVSTTLLTAPTATQCWLSASSSSSPIASTANITSSPYASASTSSTKASSYSSGSPAQTSLGSTFATSQGTSGSTTSSASSASSANRSSSAVPSSLGTAPSTTFTSLLASAAHSSVPYPRVNDTAEVSKTAPGSGSASGTISASLSSKTPGAVVAATSTSTVYSTAVYTVTRCAASVVHCPLEYQSLVVVTTTVKVAASSSTATSPPSVTASSPTSSSLSGAETVYGTKVFITDVVVLVPCKTPIVATFTPPNTLSPVSPESRFPSSSSSSGSLPATSPKGPASAVTTLISTAVVAAATKPASVAAVSFGTVATAGTAVPSLLYFGGAKAAGNGTFSFGQPSGTSSTTASSPATITPTSVPTGGASSLAVTSVASALVSGGSVVALIVLACAMPLL